MKPKSEVVAILQDRPIAFHPILARIGGSANAGLFLSQLLYWTGKQDDPDGWIYKTSTEWEEETCLSRHEQETVRQALVKTKVLEERKGGLPCRLYFKVNMDVLSTLIANKLGTNQQTSSPENGNCMPKSDEHSLTEITPEITSDIPRDVSKPTSTRGNGSPPLVTKEPTPPTFSTAGQSSKTRPAASEKKVSHRATKSPYEQMFDALATVTKLDPRLRGANARLRRAASDLSKTEDYTAEEVSRWFGEGGWWYHNDFRGEAGTPPTPENVISLILQAKEAAFTETYISPVTHRSYTREDAQKQKQLDRETLMRREERGERVPEASHRR